MQRQPRPEIQIMNDLLNLNTVPRWGVCRMHRQQNVAEHSFRVSVIAHALACELGYSGLVANDASVWGLIHDANEAYSGDPPAPFKDEIGRAHVNAAEARMLPWLAKTKDDTPPLVVAIVKIADQIEGYTWWAMWGDRNMQHPWITFVGPKACNRDTVIHHARKYAELFGLDEDECVRITLSIADSITGVTV